MARLLLFIIELSVCSNLAPGYCATKFTSLVFPHFISPDEEITNLTVNIVKHTMPAIILIKLTYLHKYNRHLDKQKEVRQIKERNVHTSSE